MIEIDNVIHCNKIEYLVLGSQTQDFVRYTRRRLTLKHHRVVIQSAERADRVDHAAERPL